MRKNRQGWQAQRMNRVTLRREVRELEGEGEEDSWVHPPSYIVSRGVGNNERNMESQRSEAKYKKSWKEISQPMAGLS